MKRFAIYGVNGCGRGVLPLVRQELQASLERGLCDLVFVDDHPPASVVNGHRVLTYEQWLSEPASSRHMNVAIANSQVREKLVQRCATDGVRFFQARAANVVQLDDVQIGEGAVLCPFVTLTSNIRIGRHFHANLYSYVEHDCVVGDFVTFAPGVMCNGHVHIEDHAYIGAGAVIKQGLPGKPLVIGRGAVVGMGAVVTQSVPAQVTVVGNPARPLIKN
jgi:sugar O-acyltransferase (sialic acid O-acetyltransferase NeuD family)